MLSSDEILSSTQQVISGLEALKDESHSLMESLQQVMSSWVSPQSGSVEQEKCDIIHEWLERIGLGLSEAQVQTNILKRSQTSTSSLCNF